MKKARPLLRRYDGYIMPYICFEKPNLGKWPRVFYWVILPSLLLFIGGCGRETQGMPGSNGTAGILSIPPSGFVRIVSRQIEDKPTEHREHKEQADTGGHSVHYKWSLIGERNWQNPKADKMGFTLGEVYPLNSTTQRGGCNIWECDLTVHSQIPADPTQPTTAASAMAEWHLTIHGSNGQTARAEGTLPAPPNGGNVENVLRVVQIRDEPVRLPADVILAKVGEQEVRLRVAQ